MTRKESFDKLTNDVNNKYRELSIKINEINVMKNSDNVNEELSKKISDIVELRDELNKLIVERNGFLAKNYNYSFDVSKLPPLSGEVKVPNIMCESR